VAEQVADLVIHRLLLEAGAGRELVGEDPEGAGWVALATPPSPGIDHGSVGTTSLRTSSHCGGADTPQNASAAPYSASSVESKGSACAVPVSPNRATTATRVDRLSDSRARSIEHTEPFS